MKKQTAVEWLEEQIRNNKFVKASEQIEAIKQAEQMEKEQMLNFGEFIIDELEPMAQNRDWVEERYNYFKSE